MKNNEDPSLKGGDCLNQNLEGVSNPLQNTQLKDPGLKADVLPKLKKKIIIAVGGTGGHIYPALALAGELKKRSNDIDIIFAGGGLLKNPYLNQSLFSCLEISCGSLMWKKPINSLKNVGKIIKGVADSYKILREFQPSLVLGFGSYHSFPLLLAARQAKFPYILHEQNSILGRVNRLFSKKAILTGVFFPDVLRQVKGAALEVGMPLREPFRKGNQTGENAKSYFGLNISQPTILVFGGSQGARSLNEEFVRKVEAASSKNFCVLHFTGNPISTEEYQLRYKKCGILACVKDFESRMDLAWQAADLLVSRAGAGTIAEQIEFEVPGILIPYPYAMDNHQETNADFMALQVGGAIKLSERDFGERNLIEEALDILRSKNLLMRKHFIQQYKRLHKPHDFCSLILDHLHNHFPR